MPTPPTSPPRRAVVEDVTAVLLLDRSDDDQAVLPVLAALATQQRRPQRLVVVGPGAGSSVGQEAGRHAEEELRLPVVLRPSPADRRDQVEVARSSAPRGEGSWLWFLATDTVPDAAALEALIAAARRSSRVGIVGPKLVRADEPRLLRSLGHHVTAAGRVADPAGAALVDQGQLDLRQDVLGMPLAGSLVNSSTLEQVGGIEPAFGADGVDGLDLGWRSHLAGHRVVVAPDAVVRQGEDGLGVTDQVRTRMRVRQVALARGSWWAAPWRAVGVLPTSLLAAVVLLLVKRPAEAAREWADVRAVLAPARGWAARWRFRGQATVRPGDLAGLHAPPGTGWRATLDTVGDALDPRPPSRRSSPEGGPGSRRRAVETGPVSEEFAEPDAAARRRRALSASWPLALALIVAAGVAGWVGRDLLGGLRPSSVGLAGPELGAATTDGAGLWASATQAWRGGGLGHDQVAEAWLRPAAALSWVVGLLPGADETSAGPALAWMLALAPVLSVLSAYVALRRATGRRWVRAGLALGYGLSAPLTGALAEGRVGPAVVHVLAPLLLAGLVVIASRRPGVRRTAAAFATAGGVALAAQWVPGVLVLGSSAGLLLLVAGRGSARWRGTAVAVLPWLLALPWSLAVLDDPVLLAGGAGATSATPVLPSAADPWQLLLLHPGAGLDPGTLGAVPLWLMVPVWLAAVGGLLLGGASGRRVALLLAVALGCLAGAQVAVRTSWGVLPAGHAEAGLAVVSWPGTLLSFAAAALVLAAGVALETMLRRGSRVGSGPPSGPRWRTALAPVATALVVLPFASSAVWAVLPAAEPHALSRAEEPLPAVASEQARGPGALRTLLLRSDGDGLLVDLQGAEPEPARILRDRSRELAVGVPEPDRLEATVESLVAGAAPEEVGAGLVDLGVGYVFLEAPEAQEHPVAADLDRVAGLTRVSSPTGSLLWRVAEGSPARARVLGPEGDVLATLPSTGPHGASLGTVDDLPGGAVLQVSEGTRWADVARVEVDGEQIDIVSDGIPAEGVDGEDAGGGGEDAEGAETAQTAPEVALAAGDHEISVAVPARQQGWHLAAAVLGAITIFLALPFGRAEDDGGRGDDPPDQYGLADDGARAGDGPDQEGLADDGARVGDGPDQEGLADDGARVGDGPDQEGLADDGARVGDGPDQEGLAQEHEEPT